MDILRSIRIEIEAQTASTAPPVGPMLSPYGFNVADFCKQFNKESLPLLKGAILPVKIFLLKDRSFKYIIKEPATNFLIGAIVGDSDYITLKEVYRIAKIKNKGELLRIESVCRMILGTVYSMQINLKNE